VTLPQPPWPTIPWGAGAFFPLRNSHQPNFCHHACEEAAHGVLLPLAAARAKIEARAKERFEREAAEHRAKLELRRPVPGAAATNVRPPHAPQ
jgi:hypothetical protein